MAEDQRLLDSIRLGNDQGDRLTAAMRLVEQAEAIGSATVPADALRRALTGVR